MGSPHDDTLWYGQLDRARQERIRGLAPVLLAALKLVVANIEDYERVNNLAPNPGRKHCWDSVAQARAVIAQAEAWPFASDKRQEAE